MDFYAPYLLEHNGEYNPKSYTGIYIEDTFEGVTSEPKFNSDDYWVSGITDDGKVIAGNYALATSGLLVKVDSAGRTKEEVKAALKNGEYCIYKNSNSSYTLMLKWWDMNDGNGFTYDQIPRVKNAGGVGNYLKQSKPEIFGELKPETIEKMNQLYKGKAVQNVFLYFSVYYPNVKEVTEVNNTLKYKTDQTGEVDYKRVAKLTPPAGVSVN